MIVDGKSIAEHIAARLRKEHTDKFLAVFSVGDDAASKSFIHQKEKVARELGIDFRKYNFSENATTSDQLRKKIQDIVGEDACGGALVQLPLPCAYDTQYILDSIPKEKDVDVLSTNARADFRDGMSSIIPPPAGVVYEITRHLPMKEKIAAVVGTGRLIGTPVSLWLKEKCKELIILKKGDDFEVLRRADIVILGTGIPKLIRPDMVKKDAYIIDFGYGKENGELCGDFEAESLPEKSSISYTPTPGGTGPILVMKLMENFFIMSSQERK